MTPVGLIRPGEPNAAEESVGNEAGDSNRPVELGDADDLESLIEENRIEELIVIQPDLPRENESSRQAQARSRRPEHRSALGGAVSRRGDAGGSWRWESFGSGGDTATRRAGRANVTPSGHHRLTLSFKKFVWRGTMGSVSLCTDGKSMRGHERDFNMWTWQLKKKLRQVQSEERGELDLRGMKIKKLPAEIGQLQTLRRLRLSYKISAFPEIPDAFNYLTDLPPEITQLKNLRTLDLSGNQFTTVPDEVAELEYLRKLDMSNNQLTDLPDWLSRLQSLEKLDMTGNKIGAIPEGVAKLPRLRRLDLFGNKIASVPAGIGRLRNIEVIDLRGNQLRTVPLEWGNLSDSVTILLFDNPLERPFSSLVRKGTAPLLAHLRSAG